LVKDLAVVNAKNVVLAGVVITAGAMVATFQGEYKGWGLDQEKEHVKRREDPASWDKALLDRDRTISKEGPARPCAFGAFPVPRYDLVGKRSFRGAGVLMTKQYPWRDHRVWSDAYFINRSPVNEKFIGDRADEVFFHILVLLDKEIRPDSSDALSEVFSRNHPHIFARGLVKTAQREIDYLAFQTADRNAYAIVNMRLFDLRAGRVVIIAPQKDGTLRSMQVEAPTLESKEVQDFDAQLLKDPRIVKFLDMPGNS
jgi:hypothetical protein